MGGENYVDEDVVRELSEEECWGMLDRQEFGRLAFHLRDEVHLVPINYAVDHGTLLFRTAEGEKLLGVVMHHDVVFEVDEYDEHQAASVIVRGNARRLEEDEAHRAENVPLRPWVSTPKYDVVEITPTLITGRSFRLDRPWLHLRPEE
ncbi:pyridoxamine 5'-phosphate oxidase family protein [Nocardioides ferulae]|uniref:pyridoxamine 5'-phosphate oxidase family protein n=1 Tax=Nocardioides ferulae TaxID=2340821 RepID=UPI000EACAC37|nr:pyridoxamine 5'-phosphate oxidase family protein [Nocardioides ferulae]